MHKATIVLFYYSNQDKLEQLWAEHLSYAELGSGEDRIAVTDRMFWDWVETRYYEALNKEQNMSYPDIGEEYSVGDWFYVECSYSGPYWGQVTESTSLNCDGSRYRREADELPEKLANQLGIFRNKE